MTRANENSEIKVGLFMLVGLVFFGLIIIILGGNQFVFSKKYILSAQFKQAQGLGSGSIVSLAGISVGHVKELKFSRESNAIKVYLSLNEDFQDQITSEAIASVKTQGALGDKYIYITPSPTGRPLQDGQTLKVDDKPDFLEAISERSEDFKGAGDIINELSSLLKNINDQNRSALLMENLTRTSKNLSQLTGDPDVKKTLIHLGNILKKVDEGDGTLGRLINDSALHEKIMSLLGDSPRNRYLKPLIQKSLQTQSLSESAASK